MKDLSIKQATHMAGGWIVDVVDDAGNGVADFRGATRAIAEARAMLFIDAMLAAWQEVYNLRPQLRGALQRLSDMDASLPE